jgi:hypothetical protein
MKEGFVREQSYHTAAYTATLQRDCMMCKMNQRACYMMYLL